MVMSSVGEIDLLQQLWNGRDFIGLGVGRHLTDRDLFLAGPGADDVQGTEVFRTIMRATNRLAVDGDKSLRVGIVRRNRVADPVLKTPLEGFGLQCQQEPANAIARGDAVGQREELPQPIRLQCGPAMNGRGTITAAEDATDRDHGDIDEEMFAIAAVPGVRERFEVTADRADINELRHERHP